MRRPAIVLLVLLLLIAGVAGVFGLLGRAGDEGAPARPDAGLSARAEEPSPPGLPPGLPTPEEAGDEDPGAGEEAPKPEGAGPTVEVPPGEAEERPAPAGETGTTGETPPAIRPNPRTPPPPRPGIRPRAGPRPGMGPTGLWERFPPEIPKGRAAIAVTVLDKAGKPVQGADVYIGPPERAGDSAVSFGDLRKIGKTGPEGVARGGRLPEGSVSVAGNLGGLLNGPRGLDMASATKTVLVADKTATAEVRLPLDLADLGSIRGRVLGPDGKPLRSVSVSVGFSHDRTKKNGRFELPFLPAGKGTLTASRYGFTRHTDDVVVEAGKVLELEIELDYTESGTLSLAGTVVGPEGEPVGGAHVYVIAKQGMGSGTVRSGEADEHGRFSFPGLPDRLAKAEVRIQANRWGYRSGNLLMPDGLESGEVEVRLPLRLVKLRLVVTDAATGAPLTRCRFEAWKEGGARPLASFSSRSEEGKYETWVEPGELELVIEAPDHETQRVTVDVGEGGGEYEYAAKLVAEGSGSAQVVLTVLVLDDASGDPVEHAKVEILPEKDGPPLAGLEGYRPGGRFVIPVSSGRRRVRVTAAGHEVFETAVELEPDKAEAEITVRLRPN
ncbi:MAG: carboxypeptidase-like regulatory domain-containing protein [Planctomycetota bacterium]|jgi:protocatechuate 3,4-dioxygenase beta subunit